MSVLLETSLGDLVIDLEVEKCPRSCLNFLKLCKSYQYNYVTFFSVQKDFLAQTGDPSNSGQGGSSVWSQLDPSSSDYSKIKYFTPERLPILKHQRRGTVSMACTSIGSEDDDEIVAGSQFFITLADDIEYLNGKHAPFGKVVEGDEEGGTLDKINASFVDKERRPLRDIRIHHLVVLDDPFDDPIGLNVPSRTPSPTPQQLAAIGLDSSAVVEDPLKDLPAEEVEENKRKADTTAAALTLEMVGDLPFAEVRPPENILFVCKLNPITRSEDLELIFSRFGKILSCEVIKDKKTGDSLQYAFIEFDQQESAEQAYFKMQNVLIDDRRIWVDFSQSVSKLSSSWNTSRSGGKPMRVMQGGDRPKSTPRVDRDLVFDFDEVDKRSRGPPRQDRRYDRYSNERYDRDHRRSRLDDDSVDRRYGRDDRAEPRASRYDLATSTRRIEHEDDRIRRNGRVAHDDRRRHDDHRRHDSQRGYSDARNHDRERSPQRSRHVH